MLIFQEIGHSGMNSECFWWVMQSFKYLKDVFWRQIAVRGEQLSHATSNLAVTYITQPQSPLQTQRAWILLFPLQIPAFVHANPPIIL